MELPRFERGFFGNEHRLSRIGRGEIGGKAAGLAMIVEHILAGFDAADFPGIEVSVPRAVVLTTDVFDAFVDWNRLDPDALACLSDDQIANVFQRGDIPPEFVGDLRALIAGVHTPLAIRSSSLLEDALDHPFAGVYGTKMIPNNSTEEDRRFRALIEAIKLVWATTYFAESRAYLQTVGHGIADERMAVIVQEVLGRRHGDRFYPTISGVARSHNFYPTGNAKPTDGVITLALGLGKTIVDGGLSWSFAPPFPKAPPPFNDVGDLIKNTQTRFWCVHMGAPPPHDPIRETEYLVEAGLREAEDDGALRFVVSTYDPGSDRLNPGLDPSGPRVLTFAPLIGSRFVRFTDAIVSLLELGERTLDAPVEIELAANLHHEDLLPISIGFLQIRPMLVDRTELTVDSSELVSETVVVASDRVLGNGRRTDVRDIVFVHPDRFDPANTPEMAIELDGVNRRLLDEDRHYLLIGFGRWGTSDPRLGIPVTWGQISRAAVIVEATLPSVNPDLSQGSHFFHNLLANRVLYLSVLHDGLFRIDWTWITGQPVVSQGRFATHARLDAPLDIRVDGASGLGVIHRHD